MPFIIAALVAFAFLKRDEGPAKQPGAADASKAGVSTSSSSSTPAPTSTQPSGASSSSYQSRLAAIGLGLGTAIGGLVDIAES